MFTGLIQGKGTIQSIGRSGGDMKMTISPLFSMDDCALGESIAVNGVCLTVTGIGPDGFSVDVSGETLSRSTLGFLREKEEVNLERALRLSDRLGGHLVAGHVDGMGKITRKEQRDRSWFFRIQIERALARYTIEKGSIAVDGISLTINRCGETFVEVNIIPETAKQTTILNKRTGDPVNIEVDLIGKYVEKFFQNKQSPPKGEASSGITGEMLTKYGFGE
ncbi:MAG: riboflavin synthase [Deltaproteobacteria bacterium]|nr:riboflavin synthase [Deltaproteobacteria bacterium]